MLRYILWIILIFIVVKIAGEIIRYVRQLLTPNNHIKSSIQHREEKGSGIEDVPYEEINDNK